MGRVFLIELEGRVYKCKFCRSHLALADDLVSRVCITTLAHPLFLFFFEIQLEINCNFSEIRFNCYTYHLNYELGINLPILLVIRA